MKDENFEQDSQRIFFMVQEMEAWFLSQPNVLDDFYNHNISIKIRRNPAEIENPSDKLFELTKNLPKKDPYHKVRHGVALLKLLDLNELMKTFHDVKRLIECIAIYNQQNK